MLPFGVAIILAFIFFILGLICMIITIIKVVKKKDQSDVILEKSATIFFGVLSIISILFADIPSPTIYPLEDNVKIYDGIVKITIDPNDSSPFIQTYYSLDGSDPEYGYIYEGPFTITSSTTVFAKNKFLRRWSEPSKSAYRFESIPITYISDFDLLISDKLPSPGTLLDYAITIFLIFAIVWIIIRKVFRNIRDRIRNFFDSWL